MSTLKRNLLILTVLLAAVMELIDATIVNVALSHISGNLGATIEDASWVVTSYSIANVIIIPMTSFLTARFGRRNYYIGSILLFTICSLMCGLSGNIWTLVFFRFMQGIGGGALLSVTQAVLFELFPKEKQATASAIFGIGVFIGPTIGPTLGGFITENYSWPWIFFVNVPVGILTAVSCYFLLTEPVIKPVVKKIDWAGIALLAIGIGTMQTVLERGETEDWFATAYIAWFTLISIVSLATFVWWELKIPNPVVDLRVLQSRTLSIAAILTFITGIGMYTSIFLMPIIAQRLLGFTPTQTGLVMLPGAVTAVFVLILTGRLMQKGLKPIFFVATGYASFIYFNWHMSEMNLDVSSAFFSYTMLFRSIGMALLAVPLTALAVSSLEPKDIPQGAALNNMMRQLGGSFGIAAIETFYTRRTAVHRMDLVSDITAYNPLSAERIAGLTKYFASKGGTDISAHHQALGMINQQVVRQSSMLSYIDSYLLIGLLFVVTLPLLLIVARGKTQGPPAIVSDH